MHSAAISRMKCQQSRVAEPWENDDFQRLVQQRKASKDGTGRRTFQANPQKKSTGFAAPKKQNQKITAILEQFQDFGKIGGFFMIR